MTTHDETRSQFKHGPHDTPSGLAPLRGTRRLPNRLREPGSYRDPEDAITFTGGPVVHIHEVGAYDIVEYRQDVSDVGNLTDPSRHGALRYHPYVAGVRTGHVFHTLDEALVYAVLYRTTDVNHASHLTRFIARSIQHYGDDDA